MKILSHLLSSQIPQQFQEMCFNNTVSCMDFLMKWKMKTVEKFPYKAEQFRLFLEIFLLVKSSFFFFFKVSGI